MNDEILLKRLLRASPLDIQQFIISDEFKGALQVMRDEFNLTEEEEFQLAAELTFVLIGLTDLSAFPTSLKTNLPEKRADNLLKRIDMLFFNPVRESLNIVHGYAEETGEERGPLAERQEAASGAREERKEEIRKEAEETTPSESKESPRNDPYREPITD